MKRLFVAAIAAIVLPASACSSNDTGTVSQWADRIDDVAAEPVTFDQAGILAGALLRNSELSAADYTIVLPDGDDTLLAAGQIRFADIEGSIDTGLLVDESGPIQWTADTIIVAGTGIEASDELRARVDGFISAMLVFASLSADNPVLVQQDGTLLAADDADTATFLVAGNRDAVVEVDKASGAAIRGLLVFDDPMLPGGRGQVVFTFDFEASR